MSTPVLKPLLKPLLIILGSASMIFFGGVIAQTLPDSGFGGKDATENVTNGTDNLTSLAVSPSNTIPASSIINAQQAMTAANQYLPNESLQAPIELVNYNGTAAYEVSLTSGPVYIDATSAAVLNPAPSNINTSKEYRYEDDDDDDEHHKDKHHKDKHDDKSHHKGRDKHEDRKKYRDEDEDEYKHLIVADYRLYDESDRSNKHHDDEESYDD
ncbi:PepSY domain-containing protein [Psychrobacter phenylpyruvicus]|uniref:PepSY domain-containing protein n=1 Tax=Psychrobacter phenylpyruvicus TaxID=29432 RepID=A0A379LKD4_9GAMM|nr:PepSY domain-containing protein [Psychrobacter phenylpyruvicus]SUD90555.1 Uncharacterised protein [Psychrobacter phenylpyruvicus]